MSESSKLAGKAGSQENPPQKLMSSGFVCPEGNSELVLEIRRGMTILSNEGLEVGKVAALVLDSSNRTATHILLSRLPDISGYWLVPVDSIAQVVDESVRLSIPGRTITSLPRWRST